MEVLIRNGMASRTEPVPVDEAAGRTTAGPVYARICAPHFNACAMDGVAIDAKLSFGASGESPVFLPAGQFVWVNTGDPLPEGCDAVVMLEEVEGSSEDGGNSEFGIRNSELRAGSSEDGGNSEFGVRNSELRAGSSEDGEEGAARRGLRVEPAKTRLGFQKSRDEGVWLRNAVGAWAHVRQVGEDICAGEMILPSYSHITPAAMGAMIAGGVSEVLVVSRPVVGIIPVGNKLVPPATDPKEGDVLEVNSAIFTAMLRDWGADAVTYPIVSEDVAVIRAALETALEECDVALLYAGYSSDGEDYTAEAISGVGKVLFNGLAIKPGKPAILGHSGAKPVIGVPGYPVSGIIVIEQLLKPVIESLSRSSQGADRCADAVLSKAVVSSPEYQEFIRVRMGFVGERLIASPLGRGSGIVTSFMKADGIIEAPQGVSGYDSGASVSVRLLRSEDELRRSLVVIGSHDPLLDELAELLRIEYGDISLGSAHVGSMGGLIAVRKGQAHIAGLHLLDEQTGWYNASFVRKVMPKGGVRLVECVMRMQGLILRKGNPLRIAGVADLARGGLRYVNRQKGSGTRILIDHMCSMNGIDTSEIYGYDREEFTHTSVAALIAAGSADVGLGVYSAAKLYDLDFVPVCQEHYDLLIPDHAWDLSMVQKLLCVLKSDAFRQRLEAMGGYAVDKPGAIREKF